MSNILNDLGLDEDDINWWDIALCLGMDTNLFFDKYEVDADIAKNIDQACLSCPVISECYSHGIDMEEHGVWGGVYMTSGSMDKSRNAHKTKDVWKELKRRHG